MKQRDYVTSVQFCGVFWQLREWCGFEPLYMLFIEDPDFVHEVISFWTEFVSRTVTPILDAGVVDVIGMDSDGRIDELMRIWIESAINVCDPIEVAAGNDINAMRKQFGHEMAYQCGVDKRCIAKGGKVVKGELRRTEPVVRDGGQMGTSGFTQEAELTET